MLHQYIERLRDWYFHLLDSGGYWGVAFLMALESTVVPIPSEVIIPPAAYLAHSQGKMSVAGVIIAGVIGSWVGAAIMYWASRLAGRPLILKFGPYFFIKAQKIEAAERWATQFGPFGVFFSRLLPVVRHLIGIPAGIVRMNFGLYSLYTILGSALWCSVLAWLGIQAGKDEALMHGELHRITLWAVGAFLVLGTIYYFFVHRQMKAAPKTDARS